MLLHLSGASTAEIEGTAAELSAFAMVLGNLHETLESTPQVVSDKAFENMDALLIYCKKALHKIQSVITTSRKTPSRLNFLKRNSLNSSLGKAKPVRLNLECLRTNLTAMMSTIILAERQNERHEIVTETHDAPSSLDTLVDDQEAERATSRTIYELDAAVERITSKLEDDIFANSRALKRWQAAERREFDEMYIRNIVPDNASPISPASQWISTLVPFQPTTGYMKRITGPTPPKAIGYGNGDIIMSASESQNNEDEEQARITAVIQVLLAKWTERQTGADVSVSSNRDSSKLNTPQSSEIQEESRSEEEMTRPSTPIGILEYELLLGQKNLKGGQAVGRKTKHVTFQDAENEVDPSPDLPNGASESTQVGEDIHQESIRASPGPTNGEISAAPSTDKLESLDRKSRRKGKESEREALYDKEKYVDEYISSLSASDNDLDGLPKAGWEQADDARPASRYSNPSRNPAIYGSRGPTLSLSDVPRDHFRQQDSRASTSMYPQRDPYNYNEDVYESRAPPPLDYYYEEEPSRARGFAETIHSSSRDPSRRRPQSDRHRDSGGYPRRRDSVARSYYESEEEPAPLNDNSKALVLRGNPLSGILQQLQNELKEAKATIELKNTELLNSTNVERTKRLELDLANAIKERGEAHATAERRAASDERNSVAKSRQIAALESRNAAQAEALSNIEDGTRIPDGGERYSESKPTKTTRVYRDRGEEDAVLSIASDESDVVEVIEEESIAVDRKPASRRRAESEFSYYTNNDIMRRQDKGWYLAQAIIILLALACGTSAVLASYIRSDNGDVMLKVLTVMPEQSFDFVVQI
jgi:hypothetical protein